MVQLRRNKKSPHEIEVERKLRLRRARDSMEKFSRKCDTLRDTYMKQAVQAKRLGNEGLLKKFAARLVNIDAQQQRAQSFVLMMNDMELNLQQLDNIRDVTKAMKDFVSVFQENEVDYESIAGLKDDMEKANINSEKLSDTLDSIMTDVGDSLTSFGNIDSDSLQSMMDRISDEAETAERSSIKSNTSSSSRAQSDEDLDRKIKDRIANLDRDRD